jgi:formylglycine-generating enzyme required for sulfatase activity
MAEAQVDAGRANGDPHGLRWLWRWSCRRPAGANLEGETSECAAGYTDAAGYEADETRHSVTLTRGISWSGAPRSPRASTSPTGAEYPSANTDCGAECPVENVNWYDAAAFANAVSDAAGLAPCYLNCAKGSANDCQPAGSPYDCEGYWIPTESEWKYTAEAGEEAAFPSGGNLWKWAHDQFDSYEGDQTDPVGPDWNGDPVMRGGCWAHFPGGVRSAFRLYGKGAGYRSNNSGFRLARTSP